METAATVEQQPSTPSSDAEVSSPTTSILPISSITEADEPRLMTTIVLRAQLLRFAMRGLNATEAAKLAKCHPQTARMHYADKSFRQEVRAQLERAFDGVDDSFIEQKKTLHEMLEERAEKSFVDLVQMLQDPDLHPSIRMRINQDFLNRHADTAQVAKAQITFDPQALMRAGKTAKEMDSKIIPMRKVS